MKNRQFPNPLTHDFTGDLLTAAEVADILKIAEATVRRYAQSGTLEAVKIGKLYCIKGDSLQKLLHPQQ